MPLIIDLNCSAVSVSNETLDSVTSQAKEADANVQRNEDLLKVFGTTLKMVNTIRKLIAYHPIRWIYTKRLNYGYFRFTIQSQCEWQMYRN